MTKPKPVETIFSGNEDGVVGKDLENRLEELPFDAERFTPEVRCELVNFVKLMGRIQAQRKNPAPQLLDKDSEQR